MDQQPDKMEQQPDKMEQQQANCCDSLHNCAEGLENSFTEFAKTFAKKYNDAKYDSFHKENRCLSTFITLFFHGIGFGVLFLLYSAKNGADAVYTGFAVIVIYILDTVCILYKTNAEPVHSLRVDHILNPASTMHEY